MRPISRKAPKPARTSDLDTEHGPARAHFFSVPNGVPRASLILGHGAGGGVNSPDLATLADELPAQGIEVVLTEQPWLVAGERLAGHKAVLDRCWIQMVGELRRQGVGLRRLVVGGRSTGARVACRTAEQTKPDALLCLAFPLIPPSKPANSRAPELAAGAAAAPTTVVQGALDKFGSPADVSVLAAEAGGRVLTVAIPFLDHSFALASNSSITESEARLILVECARRAILRPTGNSGPLLAR